MERPVDANQLTVIDARTLADLLAASDDADDDAMPAASGAQPFEAVSDAAGALRVELTEPRDSDAHRSEIIGPSDGVGDTVTWEDGIGPASPFNVYAQGWQAMGRMVVFLSQNGLTPPGIYSLAEVGSLVLPLDGQSLTFPVLLGSGDPAAPPEWFDSIKTLDDLRAAVQEGSKTIDVGPSPHFER